jgi:glycosyltransferase involved in cell wall biosynthesis
MRYLWDLKEIGLKGIGLVRRAIASFFLVFLRIWEVSASTRPDILISNSKFVAKRIEKYWCRDADSILTPPIHFHNSPILNDKQRELYFVAGAPFEFNKKGDFLLKCFAGTDIVLKLIGSGSKEPGLKRKYSKYKNIQFLGKISDEEKWDVLSKAFGFVMPGFEDYGIFPLEAMSTGTPVLAYKAGGIMENLKEGVNGYFFMEWSKENFLAGLEKILKKKWDYQEIAKLVRKGNNSEEEFIKKLKDIVS